MSYFFFQAEDGIRDDLVTGVQTCALPISGRHNERNQTVHGLIALVVPPRRTKAEEVLKLQAKSSRDFLRSEERRVGKECRCRWVQYQYIGKKTVGRGHVRLS